MIIGRAYIGGETLACLFARCGLSGFSPRGAMLL